MAANSGLANSRLSVPIVRTAICAVGNLEPESCVGQRTYRAAERSKLEGSRTAQDQPEDGSVLDSKQSSDVSSMHASTRTIIGAISLAALANGCAAPSPSLSPIPRASASSRASRRCPALPDRRSAKLRCSSRRGTSAPCLSSSRGTPTLRGMPRRTKGSRKSGRDRSQMSSCSMASLRNASPSGGMATADLWRLTSILMAATTPKVAAATAGWT